jgi:hypothetical protein
MRDRHLNIRKKWNYAHSLTIYFVQYFGMDMCCLSEILGSRECS